MSLDSFVGFDQGEGMSEAAFEQFKERMKAASAQIAAIKKEEKKQKKKEDELLKILLKFVKTSQKRDLVLLISRVLEKNIPANFVLAIILLGNEDVQQQVGNFLMLEGTKEALEKVQNAQDNAEKDDKSLIFFKEDETLPLRVKIELDTWLKNLLYQAEEAPQKLLAKAYKIEMIELERESEFDEPKFEEKKSIHTSLIQLVAFVMRDYLEQNSLKEPYEKLKNFAKFALRGILTKTKENYENRNLLN